LIFVGIRLPHQLRAMREPVKVDQESWTDFILLRLGEIAGGVLPLAWILFKFPRFAGYPWFPPFVVIGALVFLCAIWLIYRAHKDLGRSFSITLKIREQHALVTEGIYHYIRHPIYAAFALWTIAQAMLLPNWVVGLTAPVLACTLFAIRIPREEAMMVATFGDSYRTYVKQTARFIPHIF
jgi:protein-S-isoprenylcysteine O-methyltransferase Ste14